MAHPISKEGSQPLS